MVTKTIVGVLLLAAAAFGQTEPIYPRLDSMTAEVYGQLNVASSGSVRLTAGKVKHALNIAQAQVATDFPALPKTDTVLMDRGDEGGALNSDFQRLYAVQKRRGDTLRISMKIVPADSVALLEAGKAQVKGSVLSPQHCWSWGKYLRTHPKITTPIPDTFFVDYYALPPRMESNSDTCLIPTEYLGAVVWYACGLLSATRETFDIANWYLQWYENQKQPPVTREAEAKQ